jgi:hypothetical protein
MRRSEGQESDRPEDDGRSDDTLSCIMKCETHIDNHVCYRWRKVPDVFYCDIPGFRAYSQNADASRRSYGH